MLLQDKVAIIYGGGGAIGSTVALRFAEEGAHVFVADHSKEKAETVVKAITTLGGKAEASEIDVLDEAAVEAFVQNVFEKTGKVDISFNAMGIPQEGIQGIPLLELPLKSFTSPIHAYTVSHFLTARAAAKRMVQHKSGVIIMHTAEPTVLGSPTMGGMPVAWAGMEALSRDISAELARQGVRSIVIRSTGLPETKTIEAVFGLQAKALGISREQFQGMVESLTHTGRLTTLEEVTNAAVFAASDLSSNMTGAAINVTGGRVVD
jgi:NAD(P)-dependent dehydrogenase (short-subunit alcohol dehydrogenase family)